MKEEDIQRQLNQLMNEQNNRGTSKFEGYSPLEMHHILNSTFGSDSPIQLQELLDSDYQKIPILNLVKYLTGLINKSGEIKLTKMGFLPKKIVLDIYAQGFINEGNIESGFFKLNKEADSISINLTRILIEIARLTKKRNGKLSLTKTGEIIISNNHVLLKTIIDAYTTKFNWAYFDNFGENRVGQLGFGFSMILLNKYGLEKQLDQFYTDKYFKAFPGLMENITSTGIMPKEKYLSQCYSWRTFDRFLNYFGLIKIQMTNKKWDADKYITKTELFNKLINVRPHNKAHIY